VIFIYQNLISNRLIYLVHAKSTCELISFKFSDRSVQSLVSAISLSDSLSPNIVKIDLTYLAHLSDVHITQCRHRLSIFS